MSLDFDGARLPNPHMKEEHLKIEAHEHLLAKCVSAARHTERRSFFYALIKPESICV